MLVTHLCSLDRPCPINVLLPDTVLTPADNLKAISTQLILVSKRKSWWISNTDRDVLPACCVQPPFDPSRQHTATPLMLCLGSAVCCFVSTFVSTGLQPAEPLLRPTVRDVR